jgi:Zn-dependent M28 family amino/carboxypeptidase
LVFGLVGLFLRNPVFTPRKRVVASPELNKTIANGLYTNVLAMTTTPKPRNHQNPETLERIAQFIEEWFEQTCDRYSVMPYIANSIEYKNVLCHFDGESDQLVVIGAHYDVAGEQDGADDNASGVATIIELAKLIKEKGVTPKHNLQIVAYTLEEPPFFRTEHMGSYVHAEKLKLQNVDIRYMVSVEMVGYYSDAKGSQEYPIPLLGLFYPTTGHFLALIGGIKEFSQVRPIKRALSMGMTLPIYSINSPSFVPGIDFSDHLNFWRFNYPAFMLTDTAFLRNKNYHKKTDTIETLNFEKMSEVVWGLYSLVSDPDS